MKTRIAWTFVLFLACSACVEATTITYNAAGDFSASSNPNGAWSYGYCEPGIGVSSFATFANKTDWAGRSQSLPTVQAWQNGLAASDGTDPSVTYNNSGDSASAYGYTWAPHSLGLDSYGSYSSIVRWKAPQAGNVDLSATFADMGATHTVAYIIDTTGRVLFTADTTASGVSFSNAGLPNDVRAGDYVYLATSGAAGAGSVTRLDATITLTTNVPEPSVAMLIVTGSFGLLVFAWRKRK